MSAARDFKVLKKFTKELESDLDEAEKEERLQRLPSLCQKIDQIPEQ